MKSGSCFENQLLVENIRRLLLILTIGFIIYAGRENAYALEASIDTSSFVDYTEVTGVEFPCEFVEKKFGDESYTIEAVTESITISIPPRAIPLGTSYNLGYKSSDTSVATIDGKKGTVTIHSIGKTMITAVYYSYPVYPTVFINGFPASYKTLYEDAYQLVVNEKDISLCTVSLSSDIYNYDGVKKLPLVTVRDGSSILKEGIDYTVDYPENSVNLGTYTVVVNGKGNYIGKTKQDYKIISEKKQSDISIDKVNSVHGIQAPKGYLVAYKHKPFSVKAKIDDGRKLTYSSSNKKVVTVTSAGKVTVKGYGNAKITVKAAATKNKKSAKRTIAVQVVPKNVSLQKVTAISGGKMNIQWKKDSSVDGYQVRISSNKNFRSAKGKDFGKKTTKTLLKNMKKGKRYYVQVRAYKKIGKEKYYGFWSETKSVKIK